MASAFWLGERLSAYNTPAERLPETGVADWLKREAVILGGVRIRTQDAFRGLRALCQLFLRRRSRSRIAGAAIRWRSLAGRLEESCPTARSVELLPVQLRQELITGARLLLADWPVTFVDFADRAGITREHFHPAYAHCPEWLSAVIDSRLARQNRWVGESDVRAIAAELKAAGRLTKANIRETLKWQGDISDEWLL